MLDTRVLDNPLNKAPPALNKPTATKAFKNDLDKGPIPLVNLLTISNKSVKILITALTKSVFNNPNKNSVQAFFSLFVKVSKDSSVLPNYSALAPAELFAIVVNSVIRL